MEFGSVAGARSHKLNERKFVTLVSENLVLLIDFVTSEKERKECSIIVVAGNLAVYAPPVSVTPRFTAAAYILQSYVPFRNFSLKCYIPFHHIILHTYARTISPTAIKISMVTQVGRGMFVRGQNHPICVARFWATLA